MMRRHQPARGDVTPALSWRVATVHQFAGVQHMAKGMDKKKETKKKPAKTVKEKRADKAAKKK
jgi:hypothetical protein